MNRIAHITSVHPRQDVRILWKECSSLAMSELGSISLYVADGLGNEISQRVSIRDLGKIEGGRIARALVGNFRAIRAVLSEKPSIVHFHDPELIPTGIVVRLLGCKVIYDVHEDVPRQILNKHWLPRVLRFPTAWLMALLEWISSRIFTSIVAATPTIAARFPSHKTVTVHNFPVLTEFMPFKPVACRKRKFNFVYVGGLSEIRGTYEIIKAFGCIANSCNCFLDLAGSFSSASEELYAKSLSGWDRVRYHGYVTRGKVTELLEGACAGLVVLHPIPNYKDAYPIKMFEYMAAGLPVIASDFPLWRRIIEEHSCGLLVDPLNVDEIADALRWFLEYPQEAEAMGRRGREAVESSYNWDKEKDTLLGLYSKLR